MAKTETTKDTDAANEPKKTNRDRLVEGMEKVDDFNVNMMTASQKLAKAVDTGFSTYMEHREKSANEKRENVISDAFVNAARGFSSGLAAGSEAFIDMASAFRDLGPDEEQRDKMAERLGKMAFPPFFFF